MISQKEKLKAACTPGLKITIELGGLNDKAPTIVVGGDFIKSLIVKEPMVHHADKSLWSEYMYPGNEATIRYIYEGIASGYKTEVIRMISSPDRLLFLKYPKRIESYNLRRHKRVSCFMEAQIELGERKNTAVLEDLSTSGCCVSYITDKNYPDPEIGDKMNIYCPYFAENGTNFIPCKVQRCTKDSRKTILGMTFEKPSPEILIKIQDYVATILYHS
ncbi:PilZ domain-containing protein [Maridesulfovibrio salexigens]|uniref:Type IV pilus assembly PilZ n=1 Tax=Maridesulfovibrio salexigens (strain ATCC 14822 / DSM 2638 / NCIMB 8403 / VKM B-1763) TaxID=526222 RepID=C6C0T1_MARSD|nr:flagellar brake protein [Maridesulfovibrio salexigens]ACS81028.1 type IV pilus assembly PilZ [Maridesulfovibrio salexigens DSM 2638]